MSLGLTRKGGGMVGKTGLSTDVGLSLLFVSREKGERKENVGNRCVLGGHSEGLLRAFTGRHSLLFSSAGQRWPSRPPWTTWPSWPQGDHPTL